MSNSRRFYTTLRIVKSGFINLSRNAWLTIAATAVMVVSLTIILLAVVMNTTANNAINELARNLKAAVYFYDSASDTDKKTLQTNLGSLDFVERVDLITQDQAKKDFAGDFKDNKDILQAFDLVGGDALPSSLRITVSDLERMPEVKDYIDNGDYKNIVEEVSLGQVAAKDTIDSAAAAQRYINTGSILSASVLSLVSIMIVFNTIRMAIYTRRDEIRIMKLIGATPDYIRGPFMVEASLYGVIAGIISTMIVYSLVFSLGSKVSNQPEFSQTYAFFTQTNIITVMLMGSILVGILISSVSSMLAMEKHLRLKDW